MGWKWLVVPMLGAGIGWITNFVAIRMLFRPKNPLRLIGGLTLQGVIPRRRKDLARVVAEAVQTDLLPMDELLDNVDVDKYEQEVVDAVVRHIDRRLEENVLGTLPGQLRKTIIGYVRRVVEREARAIVQGVSGRLVDRIRHDFDVGAIVHKKMEELDTEALESLVHRVARQELRMIELLGGVLGFIIGLLQVALMSLA